MLTAPHDRALNLCHHVWSERPLDSVHSGRQRGEHRAIGDPDIIERIGSYAVGYTQAPPEGRRVARAIAASSCFPPFDGTRSPAGIS